MTATVTLDPRFNGPPDTAQGGYVCGILAEAIGGDAEVTLRRPPPLGRPLTLERAADGRVRLLDGDALLAEGAPAEVALEAPPAPDLAEAEAAARRSPRLAPDAFYPTCVACGPERAPGDGFRIFPGPLEGSQRVVAAWTPDASLAGEGGRVRPAFLWAALDCPSGIALQVSRGHEPCVLGRLAGALRGHVRAGEPHVLVGWSLGEDGRKLHAATALYSATGALRGVARATWILLRSPGPGDRAGV